jgi:putative endonuclease
MKHPHHLTVGAAGEEAGVKYLRERGYRILHRNWRYEKQEIDIVAESKDFTIIVEVKSRRQSDYMTARFGPPSQAITPAKRRYIRGAGELYRKIAGAKKPLRFDVIEVLFSPDEETLIPIDIHHMEDAF